MKSNQTQKSMTRQNPFPDTFSGNEYRKSTEDQSHEGAGNTSGEAARTRLGQGLLRIEINDDIEICTPDDLKMLTPYVLLEKEEWIDPEIAFVNDYLEPGMNVLDIGAGFGTYALPMAKTVGPEGKVYAFEPGSTARHCLEIGKRENGAENLDVTGHAVSDQPGRTGLVETTPELIRIDDSGTGDVKVVTLDAWWLTEGRPDVNLIKLDINGNESRALAGADRLLGTLSPVLLVSVGSERKKAGRISEFPDRYLKLQLEQKGYHLYEYIPGPMILTPFDPKSTADPSLMNLVAMKEEEAELFRKSGGIHNETLEPDEPEKGLWKSYLKPFPWTGNVMEEWIKQSLSPADMNYLQALDYLCAAEQIDSKQGGEECRSEKAALLLKAAHTMVRLYNSGNNTVSLSFSLARILNNLGKRGQAAEIMQKLISDVGMERSLNAELPFLLPDAMQDMAPVHTRFASWLTVRAAEAWILLEDRSTYYSSSKELKMLEALAGNPEVLPGLEKRFGLSVLKRGRNLEAEQRDRIVNSLESDRNQILTRLINNSQGLRNASAGAEGRDVTGGGRKVTGGGRKVAGGNRGVADTRESGDSIPSPVIKIGIEQVSRFGLDQEVRIPKREIFRFINIFKNHEYSLPDGLRLRTNAVVLDVGANVGIFALYASQWAENVQIECFEPNPQVHSLLELNTSSLKNIRRHYFAMGNEESELDLFQHPVNTGQATTSHRIKGAKKIQVPVRDAGKVIEEKELNEIDVLKIDTEGAEVSILNGLREHLDKTKFVMAEYHSEKDRKRIDGIMSDFMIYSVSVDGLRGVGTVKYIHKRYLNSSMSR